MLKLQLFICLFIIGIIMSCNRPDCLNENPVFDQFTPEMNEYKVELNDQIETIGMQNLRYWVEEYFEREGGTFLRIHIQGEGLCAMGELLVTDWKGMEDLKATKAMGYRGAELNGLTYELSDQSQGNYLIYKDIIGITD